MSHITAFLSGLLFAAGLAVAGMTQPSKVVGFLDVSGAWDPSLAFVMVGAIAVYAIAHRLSLSRSLPLCGVGFERPSATELDRRLLAGAALFGVGWGLSGFCPGPALASLATGSVQASVFVAGMLGGIALMRVFDRVFVPAPETISGEGTA